MNWSRLLHDFMLGAMLGDRESEDWVLAMLGPRSGDEADRRRGELQQPHAYELPYWPTDADMRGLVEQPVFHPGEDQYTEEDVLLSAPGETEPRAASAAGPEEAQPRWWEHGTRLEKRYHWHVEKGRSPEQARQLVEQERRVLESDIADPWSYLSYAASFGDEKYGKGGQVKRWDELTKAEHVLEGWFRSQGLGREEAQRRAAQEAYLLGPEGPANLKSWLRHLGSLGPSMYDEEGRLKRPGTFATEENNLVSDVIYGSAKQMSRAQAERAVAEMTRLAPDQLAPAVEQDLAWTLGSEAEGPITIDREGYGYRLLPVVQVGGPAQVRMGETGPRAERPSRREQTERQAWRNLALGHSMFEPDVLTLPIRPRPVGPPDGFRKVQPGIQDRRLQARSDYPGIQAMTPEEKEYHDAVLAHEAVLASHRQLHEDAKALPTQRQWGDILGGAGDVLWFAPRVLAHLPAFVTGSAKGMRRELPAGEVADEGLWGVGESVLPYLFGTLREELAEQQAAYERGEGPRPDPVKLFGKRFSEILEAPNEIFWWPSSEQDAEMHERALETWERLKAAEEALKQQRR